MIPPLHARLAAASVLATALACSGGGGGGDQSFTDPGHQDSALEANKLAGIGDSIMEGEDVTDFADQRGYSFAQGTSHSVFSLYSRYQVVSGLPGGKEFVSFSGATMIGDALDQAVAICEQTTKPNRVVILLGANDICQSGGMFPSTSSFGSALADTLDELAGCLPSGSWVHVLSIPRLDLLYSAVQDKQESVLHMSCPDFFQAYIPCTVAADSPTAVGSQVVAYNDAIWDEVDAASSNPTYIAAGLTFSTDWDENHVNPSIGTYEFTAADVSSIDCFHPSVEGQAKLACGAWESWEGLGNASACF